MSTQDVALSKLQCIVLGGVVEQLDSYALKGNLDCRNALSPLCVFDMHTANKPLHAVSRLVNWALAQLKNMWEYRLASPQNVSNIRHLHACPKNRIRCHPVHSLNGWNSMSSEMRCVQDLPQQPSCAWLLF